MRTYWKGIELKEITTPNIDNLPKKMLVWDGDCNEPYERVVCAVAVDNCGGLFFIARTDYYEQNQGVCVWKHCAEIPEEQKPRRATKRELVKWIAQGRGEWQHRQDDYGFTRLDEYILAQANEPCDEKIVVRKWDDTEWHEPTEDYMGLEEK